MDWQHALLAILTIQLQYLSRHLRNFFGKYMAGAMGQLVARNLVAMKRNCETLMFGLHSHQMIGLSLHQMHPSYLISKVN
jgi:hypothetical protein